MLNLSSADAYFGFRPPAVHKKTCSRYGSGVFEVGVLTRPRLRTEERGGDAIETIIRLVCRECGVVHAYYGEQMSIEQGSTEHIGYGAKAQRCAGVWLHPCPTPHHLRDDKLGPEIMYVTGSPHPPADHDEVIGIVGWTRPWKGSRHGAPRWWAGHRITETGQRRTPAPQDYRSRTAAVRWVVEQHQAAHAGEPAYPAHGSAIPGQPGYVVGTCGHRVAGSEWRSGLRTCERCPSRQTSAQR